MFEHVMNMFEQMSPPYVKLFSKGLGRYALIVEKNP